jgi:hypothetical protein
MQWNEYMTSHSVNTVLTRAVICLMLLFLTTPRTGTAIRPSLYLNTPTNYFAHSCLSTTSYRSTDSTNVSSSPCGPSLLWPIRQSDGHPARTISQHARIPLKNWFPGHRGIDIAVGTDSAIIASGSGKVHFAGKVGGKDVLSLEITIDAHGTSLGEVPLIMTFEPARTKYATGDPVHAGEEVASIDGTSDHCSGGTVHLGTVRSGTYIDPLTVLTPSRIDLKPD